MAEKRRGLGRGLGALIPSAPAEDVPERVQPEREPEVQQPPQGAASDPSRKQGGRPVDLFFERVTEEDVAEQPRSYSSALRSGINKNVMEAQSKRVAKSNATRRNTVAGEVSSEVPLPEAGEQATPVRGATASESAAHGSVDPDSTGTSAAVTDAASAKGVPASSDAAPPPASEASRDEVSRVSRKTISDSPLQDRRESSSDRDALVDVPGATFADLPLDSIHPNRKQPRTEFDAEELAELVHSIREIGVLQPVVVRPSQEGGDAAYELVMGERRWRASRQAGMETIPAIIRSTLDDDLLRDALLENLHRSALNPLEEAAAYQQLLDDFGCSHDELAGRLGRSRPQISNTLRLMKLPPLVQRRVAAGVLSAGHARALLGLGAAADMEKLAQRIVAEGLSVRSTEEIVALSGGVRRVTKSTAPREGARHERLDYLASSLSDRLDTNVRITLGAKKGRVSIEFASVDDLNRIVDVLSPKGE